MGDLAERGKQEEGGAGRGVGGQGARQRQKGTASLRIFCLVLAAG